MNACEKILVYDDNNNKCLIIFYFGFVYSVVERLNILESDYQVQSALAAADYREFHLS